MNIAVIGINHKSATLIEREEVARLFANHFSSNACDISFPFILLSTCNRSELYFQGKPNSSSHRMLSTLLEKWDSKMYLYFDRDCLFHLAKVTSGLDSALLGETEIQGQVKRVYNEALEKKKLPSELHFLFQKSLRMGKRMRRELHLDESLSSHLWKRACPLFPNLKERKILFVGASKTNAKIAKYFHSMGCRALYFSNRTEIKAIAMAKSFSGHLQPFGDYEGDFDLMIFATTSDKPLFTRKTAETLSKELVIFDLGLPRNVESPLCSEKITLVNMAMIEKSFEQIASGEALHLLERWVDRAKSALRF